MNIKFKLTFRFTLILAGILFGSFYIAYQNYANYRENNFYDRLNDRSRYLTSAFLDIDGLDTKTLLALSNYSLSVSPNLRISLYDSSSTLIKAIGNQLSFDPEFKVSLKTQPYIELSKNDTQYIYFVDTKHKRTVFAVAAAYDKTGFTKVSYLRNLFISIWLISVFATAIAGWFFAKISLQPINQVINEVRNISASELHNRLTIHNSKDEIAHLSKTFNNMLDRLEASFALQKDFVSNASHEFRTPLTSMKGQIQVALLKERNSADYITLLQSLNDDINNNIGLLNALQELAKANADFPLKAFYAIPILDVVVDAQNELIKNKPQYHIDISVGEVRDDDIELMYCKGDYNLLKSAFTNLMDNGCKFSPTLTSKVHLAFEDSAIKIMFEDEGVGIGPENLNHIFEPFFRANDTRNVYGHGIGLSLVKRILEWHKGTINVDSKVGRGTIFTVYLPNSKATPLLKV